jgi:hypothetical protein
MSLMNMHTMDDSALERQLATLRRMIAEGRMVRSNGSDPLLEAENLRHELENTLKERAAMRAAR